MTTVVPMPYPMMRCPRLWRPTHIHLKSGGLYRVFGDAVLEKDLSVVTIYSDVYDNVWVRPSPEFHDGRFMKLSVSRYKASGVSNTVLSDIQRLIYGPPKWRPEYKHQSLLQQVSTWDRGGPY